MSSWKQSSTTVEPQKKTNYFLKQKINLPSHLTFAHPSLFLISRNMSSVVQPLLRQHILLKSLFVYGISLTIPKGYSKNLHWQIDLTGGTSK